MYFLSFLPDPGLTTNIQCNGGPNPTKASSIILDVAAGSTVKAIWRHTLTSSGSDVVDASHKVLLVKIFMKWTLLRGFAGTSHGIHEESVECCHGPGLWSWMVQDLGSGPFFL